LLLSLFRILSYVKLVHGYFGSAVNQALERIDRSLKTRLDDVHFVLRDRFQHVIRGILPRRRAADAYLQSHKLRGPQCLNDRLDAVVASMPPGLFDLEAARFQIQIVMDENQIVDGELQLTQKTFKRRARHIHEVESPGEFDQLRSEPSGPSLNDAAPGKTNRPSSRGTLDDPHPDVVTGLGIGSAWIAQSNNEAQRYFFFSASFFSAF